MPDFKARLQQHVEHIKKVGPHCQSEETTKQALVLPLLNILDFSPFDPTKVQAEYFSNFPGVKAKERVDYALFSEGNPVMFIEAKPYIEKLTNHTGQLSRYFNATPGVAIAAITNGREWRFFTDLKHPNIMDTEPFLIVDFHSLTENDFEQLSRFRYDSFHPDKLKTFAEERVYISIFQNVIEACLREPDTEFVKFVATRANLAPKLTTRFIETITPLVKQSVSEAISCVVVSGLSAPPPPPPVAIPAANDDKEISNCHGDQVDPNNPRIITTKNERQLLSIIQDMFEGEVLSDDIVGKDTESYFAVLYQGKVNRWLVRYSGDRAKPLLTFCMPLSEQHKKQILSRGLEVGSNNSIILTRPENIMKLSGLLHEALSYCQNDNNFKRDSSKKEELEVYAQASV